MIVTIALLVSGCFQDYEWPYRQVEEQARADLPCDGDIRVDKVSDADYCAYGCGLSHRYTCSDVSGDCEETWPDWCL